MVSMFLLLGCNLSYIVDLFAGLHEFASASVRTLLKLPSLVSALLKPFGDTLNGHPLVYGMFSCVRSQNNCSALKTIEPLTFWYLPGVESKLIFRTMLFVANQSCGLIVSCSCLHTWLT